MSDSSIDFDTVLHLCRTRACRVALAVLAEQQRPLTLNDLTRSVVRYTCGSAIEEVPTEEAEEIQRTLHHLTVPKAVDLGLVEYDHERQLVTPTSRLEKIQPHLSVLIDADPALEAPIEW